MLVFPETTSFDGSDRSGYVWTGPQGTPGYLDPDYYKSFRLTEKSDVYSFGVVMLELISGLKAVDGGREKTELTLADMMVSKIQMDFLNEVVDRILVNEDGVDVAAEKDDRPDAREVVDELKRIRSRTRGGSSNVNSEQTLTKGELPMCGGCGVLTQLRTEN